MNKKNTFDQNSLIEPYFMAVVHTGNSTTILSFYAR